MTSRQSASHSRFQLPSSIRLLVGPGIRGLTLVFLAITSFLFVTAYIGRSLGLASTWTVVFAVGVSAAGTYLVFAPLALSEKARSLLLFSTMKRRIILLALVFVPILSGTLYWISQAGSVEALPVFPLVIAIFYAWILLQAYFIATPVSQALARVERGIVGKGYVKKILRTIGTGFLFLPIVPLVLGVWEISSWSTQNYQNVPGAGDKILVWTMVVLVSLISTYFLTVLWGWKSIKQNNPQKTIFAGGTFLVLWGYLLYRATSLLMGYVAQNQPSNALVDTGLMTISILGAVQTFARKTVNRADRRWGQILPFLVFSFGSVYAVAQFYFILQAALTRADLSVIVNATVFGSGLLLMMLLIRRHLASPGPLATSTAAPEPNSISAAPEPAETSEAHADSSLENVERSEANPEEASNRTDR